ncbi:hypothetical protein Gbro_1151 [Gordonia bronchialis DSM 43247]|uniref:Lipoyl-binding domain-containing protein n=1 Tax=Gordonia bronchialis (strain ATCC 25592 / DSM 43247 / BCRC 13721 / JCM 3198 / KCTC 3076 / NBRC 16047 / NCTC 10667) TaxID=526226 RepID=D0L507_GORB4|nr:hypothetical protein Gbro_1151 [Gordonia bronchialis DSM 43247]STQ63264.1 Acetyl/propionyl-CoA carboxylase, alpha subunit [Gordonia bronchialis]
MVAAVSAHDGRYVRVGEVLAVVESPGGRFRLESPFDGVVHGVDLRPGAAIAPGAVFAVIGAPDLQRSIWGSLHRLAARLSPMAPRADRNAQLR